MDTDVDEDAVKPMANGKNGNRWEQRSPPGFTPNISVWNPMILYASSDWTQHYEMRQVAEGRAVYNVYIGMEFKNVVILGICSAE